MNEFFPINKRTESRLEGSLRLLVSAFLSLAEEQIQREEQEAEEEPSVATPILGSQTCINTSINPLL
jgi:hypothetical protein